MPYVTGFQRDPVLVGHSSLQLLTCCVVLVPSLDVLPVDASSFTHLGVVESNCSTNVEVDAVVLVVLGVDFNTCGNDVVQFGLDNIIQGQQLNITHQEVCVLTDLNVDHVGSADTGLQSDQQLVVHIVVGVNGGDQLDLLIGVSLIPLCSHLLIERDVQVLEGPELDFDGAVSLGGFCCGCLGATSQDEHGQSQQQRNDLFHVFSS